MKEKSENRANKSKAQRFLTSIIGVPLAVWALGLLVVCVWLFNLELGGAAASYEDRGTFGDVFGMSNSLFSGFAVIGLIWTIALQRSEINRLNNLSVRREFETTFFELLRSFNEISSQITIRTRKEDIVDVDGDQLYQPEDGPYVGKDAFAILLSRFQRHFDHRYESTQNAPWNMLPPNHPIFSPKLDLYGRPTTRQYRTFYSAYNSFLWLNGQHLGHYFRAMYIVLNHIDSSDVPNKAFYATILRSHLSELEGRLLMMNYASSETSVEFNRLVDTYAMLQNTGGKSPASHCLEFFHLEASGKNKDKVVRRLTYRARQREINGEPKA